MLQSAWKYSVYADNRKLDIKFITNYSRQCRENGWKPHSFCILAEYCFSLIKWMKKEHPFVVKLRWQIKKTPTKKPYMSIVNTLSLESNRQWIIRSWKTSYTDERYRSSAHMIYSLYICIFLSYQGAYKEELSHLVLLK